MVLTRWKLVISVAEFFMNQFQLSYFSVLTSIDLSFQLMMLVDYAGSIFPVIAHVPWNGLHLAEFVMPFFLFVAGISVAIVYKVICLYYLILLTAGIWFNFLEIFFILVQSEWLMGIFFAESF